MTVKHFGPKWEKSSYQRGGGILRQNSVGTYKVESTLKKYLKIDSFQSISALISFGMSAGVVTVVLLSLLLHYCTFPV